MKPAAVAVDRRRRDGRERRPITSRRGDGATSSSSTAPTAPGGGSTGRATGGFRAQYATRDQCPALAARPGQAAALRGRDRRGPGLPPGAAISGSRSSQAELAALDAGRRVQHAEGLHEAVVGRARRHRAAQSRRSGSRASSGGAFCPSDGFIRPLRDSRGLPRAAAPARRASRVGRRGDGLAARRPTVGSPRSRRRAGPIAVEAVVNAAGPWAAAVAAMAGHRASGDAAPPPGRGHHALRPAPRRHADDHLGRRRLSSAGAGRPGAPALAHARRRRAAVRRAGSIRRGSMPSTAHGARPGAGAPRGRRSTGPRAGPGCTRCRPTSTPFWARRPSARTSTSSTALPGTG